MNVNSNLIDVLVDCIWSLNQVDDFPILNACYAIASLYRNSFLLKICSMMRRRTRWNMTGWDRKEWGSLVARADKYWKLAVWWGLVWTGTGDDETRKSEEVWHVVCLKLWCKETDTLRFFYLLGENNSQAILQKAVLREYEEETNWIVHVISFYLLPTNNVPN